MRILFCLVLSLFISSCVSKESRKPSDEIDSNQFLLLNGGSDPRNNYLSHVRHIQQFDSFLSKSGFASSERKILSASGKSSFVDTAIKIQSSSYYSPVLSGTPIDKLLESPLLYSASEKWIDVDAEASPKVLGKELARKPANDLFLFVTDHGEKSKTKDPMKNSISLWYDKIEVDDLQLKLEKRKGRTRVLMSQCFSGGFARMSYLNQRRRYKMPDGKLCGYFSTLPDRYAYGCYPETKAKSELGHSFKFIRALKQSSEMTKAHALVQGLDQTPDVPVSSSELFVHEIGFDKNLFEIDWKSSEKDFAKSNSDEYKAYLQIKNRIEQSFGILIPDSLERIRTNLDLTRRLQKEVSAYNKNWRSTLNTSSNYNFRKWTDQPENKLDLKALEKDLALMGVFNVESSKYHKKFWKDKKDFKTHSEKLKRYSERLEKYWSSGLKGWENSARKIVSFTPKDRKARIESLYDRAKIASRTYYLLIVKEAALMRAMIQYQYHLARFWTLANKNHEFSSGIANLRECEKFSFSPLDLKQAQKTQKSLEIDSWISSNLDLITPSWLGINFKPEPKGGEVMILEVFPGSPADKAGLEIGDIVFGFGDSVMQDSYEIKERVMVTPRDSSLDLRVKRRGKEVKISLILDRFPKELPEIKAPEKGEKIAAMSLKDINGIDVVIAGERKDIQILFFWATWCGPCKRAIVPFHDWLLKKGIDPGNVLAVSDEDPELLKSFLKKRSVPFKVVSDIHRTSFSRFKIQGTPAWIWLGKDGSLDGSLEGYRKGMDFNPR